MKRWFLRFFSVLFDIQKSPNKMYPTLGENLVPSYYSKKEKEAFLCGFRKGFMQGQIRAGEVIEN